MKGKASMTCSNNNKWFSLRNIVNPEIKNKVVVLISFGREMESQLDYVPVLANRFPSRMFMTNWLIKPLGIPSMDLFTKF